MVVPSGAVTIRCELVSGGSGNITGVMVIDDFSVARAPVANLLVGNFWVNPSFELGTTSTRPPAPFQIGIAAAVTPTICQVITNNFTSATHALAVIDTNATGSVYGEWYSDVSLAGNASPGDTLSIQWFEMYNLSAPEMRLTVLFFNGSDSAGWELDRFCHLRHD